MSDLTNEEKIAKILTMQEVTTKNVDTLTTDVKGLVNTMPQFARVDEKYKSISKRIDRIEAVLSWAAKIIGTAVLLALLGTVIQGRV